MVSFKLVLKYAYHRVATERHPGAFSYGSGKKAWIKAEYLKQEFKAVSEPACFKK